MEAQGKGYRSIASDDRCLLEALDSSSVNIFARDAFGITCALRINELATLRQTAQSFSIRVTQIPSTA